MDWKSLETLPEGALVKILMRDENTGAMAPIAKTDKKMKAANHKHPSDCHALVLEGKLVDQKVGEIKKGMYRFFPADVEHGPEEVDAGTPLFLYANGPLQ
ncbi:MAG: cupin domain-containing protein [Candidatus Bathyarchaeota archaeon]|nr:cupin domain-containing protein [Candidatus Bathyarchaeota archaeon]